MLAATKFTVNTTLIALFDLSIKVFSFIFILFLARNISINDFGLYSFIVSFFYFFWTFSDFGLQNLTARAVAEGNLKILNESFATRFYMSLITFVLCLAITLLIVPVSTDTKLLIVLYSLSLFSIAITESILPVFRGTENFIYERLVYLSKNIFFVLIAGIGVYLTRNLLIVVLVFVSSEIFGSLISIYLFKKNYLDLSPNWFQFRNFSIELLMRSLPLLVGIGLIISYYKIDSIMLNFIKGSYELGIYSSAYRIFEALIFIPLAVHATILPRLIKIEKDNYSIAIDKVVKVLLLISSVLSILIIYYSRFIPLLYGQEGYRALVAPLRVIFLVTPIAFLNHIYIAIIFVEKRETKALIPLFLTVLINIATNLYFIPKYSYLGAAWTTYLSELILFIMLNYIVISKSARKNKLIVKFYFAFLISLSLMYIFEYSVILPWLALLIYSMLLYVFKVFNGEDVDAMKKICNELVKYTSRKQKDEGSIGN